MVVDDPKAMSSALFPFLAFSSVLMVHRDDLRSDEASWCQGFGFGWLGTSKLLIIP